MLSRVIFFALPPKALYHHLAELDALAQRYHCRPSALLEETDPEWAYQVDSAAYQVGLAIERKIRQQVRDTPPPEPPPKMIRADNGPLLIGTLRMAA